MFWPFRKAKATMAFEPVTGEVAWAVSDSLVPYPEALAFMEARAAAIAEGRADEMIWLLEHPPLYTAGTSAKRADLVDARRFPVFDAGRGGQYTYHGPGQRVAYVMLNLKKRAQGTPDVRAFVHGLEQWIIDALAEFNLRAERREGRVGLWIPRGPGSEVDDKIAAIGIRIRNGVSFHGIAVNVEPDLTHYAGIVPCGIAQHGVTSLVKLGYPVTLHDLDVALKRVFRARFPGSLRQAGDPLAKVAA